MTKSEIKKEILKDALTFLKYRKAYDENLYEQLNKKVKKINELCLINIHTLLLTFNINNF